METIGLARIVITIAFLVGLGLIWFMVRRHAGSIAPRLAAGRALHCTERLALAPGATAYVVDADGARLFVVVTRRGGVEIAPLPPAPETGAA